MIKVTEIEFDFTSDDDWVPTSRHIQEIKSSVFDVVFNCEEDELVDLISDTFGWCVQHIDYVVLAESY